MLELGHKLPFKLIREQRIMTLVHDFNAQRPAAPCCQ